MEDLVMTSKRLKALPALEWNVAWCAAELERGQLISEQSIEEWATQAKGILASEVIEKAVRASENIRKTIRARMERDKRERDILLSWIDAIPKEDARASVFLHYAKGYSYAVIAAQYFGHAIRPETVRMICYRSISGKKTAHEKREKMRCSCVHGKDNQPKNGKFFQKCVSNDADKCR